MFNVILLTSALYVFSSLQNRTSSHVWYGEREVPVGLNRSLFPGPFVIPLPLGPLAVPLPRRFASASACVVCFGARCFDQQCVPHRRGQFSRHLVHFEDCLERPLVEALLLELEFSLGRLGCRCRRSSGFSFSLGSAGGSSKLPSLLLSASAAVPSDDPWACALVHLLSAACLVVEPAGHYFLVSSALGRAGVSGEHECNTFASHQILARRGCN